MNTGVPANSGILMSHNQGLFASVFFDLMPGLFVIVMLDHFFTLDNPQNDCDEGDDQ